MEESEFNRECVANSGEVEGADTEQEWREREITYCHTKQVGAIGAIDCESTNQTTTQPKLGLT